jgi:predicted transcriptional regulator
VNVVVAKRSISVPEEIWRQVQEIAEEENMTPSAVISRELERLIRVRAGLAGVRWYEEQRGAPFTAEELASADAEVEEAWRRADEWADSPTTQEH